jgi:hypothetical protein
MPSRELTLPPATEALRLRGASKEHGQVGRRSENAIMIPLPYRREPMKSLFSVFLGCAGAVLAQNPQAKQEKASPQPMSIPAGDAVRRIW